MKDNFDPIQQANEVAEISSLQIKSKYAKGQSEHGGNFFAKPTVNNIREEVLDLIAYTHVLENHKDTLVRMLREVQERLDDRPDGILGLDDIITFAENL